MDIQATKLEPGVRVKRLFLIVLCSTLLADATFAAPSGGAATPFVTATASARATVNAFDGGSLAVTVTCRRACHATVFATIRASVAKRLGFAGAQGKFVLVGTGTKTLAARTPTKIRVVPTAAAKKHLKGPVDVVGSAKGVPSAAATVNNYFAGWFTTLS